MEKVRFYLTAVQDERFDRYFPPHILEQLREMGELRINPHHRGMTQEELEAVLPETDILITHWSPPQLTEKMLSQNPQLRLVAHAAGTVAQVACEGCFDRGIPVLSANPIMARYVAEGCIGYMMAGLRSLSQLDQRMKEGVWPGDKPRVYSLLGASIGMIGLGAVARELLDLLRVFHVHVYVYDPYMRENALASWPFAQPASFEEAMAQPIVSIHAAKTPETYHMIDARALAMMPDGALLLNSSRGALVDTQALIAELETGRIFAVLDVFEKENVPLPEGLTRCRDNTLLQPHMLAAPVTWEMTQAIVDDIRRMLQGEELRYTVTRQQFRMMTQEK